MNCPLATSRLFIGTLHQVHRRSGSSGAVEAGALGPGDMAGIVPEHQESCQPRQDEAVRKNFFHIAMHIKKIMV